MNNPKAAEPAGRLAIDKVVGHFERISKDKRKLKVEAWGLDVYALPINVLTWQRVALQETTKGTLHGFVEAMIACAVDKEGNPLFTADDRMQLLTQADQVVVTEVGHFLMHVVGAKETEKN